MSEEERMIRQIDGEIDDLLEHGFKPKRWMAETNRVIEAYKGEVETLRVKMRGFEKEFNEAMRGIQVLAAAQAKIAKLLEENKKR